MKLVHRNKPKVFAEEHARENTDQPFSLKKNCMRCVTELLNPLASLLKFSHDGMSCEITKLMQIPMNNLCYLIKVLAVFPACVIYSPFVALSIFVVLSNFCHLLTLCYLLTFYVTYAPATPRIINGI